MVGDAAPASVKAPEPDIKPVTESCVVLEVADPVFQVWFAPRLTVEPMVKLRVLPFRSMPDEPNANVPAVPAFMTILLAGLEENNMPAKLTPVPIVVVAPLADIAEEKPARSEEVGALPPVQLDPVLRTVLLLAF